MNNSEHEGPDTAHDESDQSGRFRAVVEAAPTGLMTVDRNGRIVLVNRQVEALFGYDRSALVGMSIETLIPERFRGSHPALRDSYFRASSDRRMGAGRDLFGLRQDGTEFPIEIGLSPQATADGQVVHCSIVDVTERTEKDRQLREHVEELRRYRTVNDHLGEMTTLLQHADSTDEALRIASVFGQKVLGDLSVGIYLLPASGDNIELAASWGDYAGQTLAEPSSCWALRRSHTHRSGPHQAANCTHLVDAESSDGRPVTCIPMYAHGQWLGTISIMFDGEVEEPVREHFETVGKSVADQTGLALSNLQLRAELKALAIRDGLTGLFNRRYLDETAERELRRAERRGQPLGVIMLDIDHFKHFNDRYGHQHADTVLREVANLLANGVRKEDVACRYGGEEFVVLMPDCPLQDATDRAERIRQQVMDVSREKVTCSIGIAAYPEHAEQWGDLLRAADAALYQAKNAGRNRCVVAIGHPQHADGSGQGGAEPPERAEKDPAETGPAIHEVLPRERSANS